MTGVPPGLLGFRPYCHSQRSRLASAASSRPWERHCGQALSHILQTQCRVDRSERNAQPQLQCVSRSQEPRTIHPPPSSQAICRSRPECLHPLPERPQHSPPRPCGSTWQSGRAQSMAILPSDTKMPKLFSNAGILPTLLSSFSVRPAPVVMRDLSGDIEAEILQFQIFFDAVL